MARLVPAALAAALLAGAAPAQAQDRVWPLAQVNVTRAAWLACQPTITQVSATPGTRNAVVNYTVSGNSFFAVAFDVAVTAGGQTYRGSGDAMVRDGAHALQVGLNPVLPAGLVTATVAVNIRDCRGHARNPFAPPAPDDTR